jgi:serine protease Do
MAGMLDALSEEVAELAARAVASVVGVGASGSGVVVGADRVLTNAHNLHGEEVIVTRADGSRASAAIAGVDPEGDLALLTVTAAGTPAVFAEAPPRPGELVVALANPGGRGSRVSLGVVSAVDVGFRGPVGRRIPRAIEHTAPLLRGSSGGALLARTGELAGINTSRQGDGYYRAVPTDAALLQRIESLARGEVPERVRLGVALAPPSVAARLRRAVGLEERDGLLVQSVDPEGPAAAAGVREGDLLVAAGGRAVRDLDDLAVALAGVASGGTIELVVVRGVEERRVEVAFPAP